MENINFYRIQWGNKKTIGFGLWANQDSLENKIGTSVINTTVKKIGAKNNSLYELTFTNATDCYDKNVTLFNFDKGELKVVKTDKRKKVYVSKINKKEYSLINSKINNFIGNQYLAGSGNGGSNYISFGFGDPIRVR